MQAAPSPWIARWSHLLPPGCSVLDVACGSGRHLAWFHARGHTVTGIDRELARAQQAQAPGVLLQADIESGPWPLGDALAPTTFGAVVVTHYLWRPLFPVLLRSLQPGGVLLYETFAVGHEKLGRPTRPDFLLQGGELLQMCAAMDIIAYENGRLEGPPRCMQRIAARAPGPALPPGNLTFGDGPGPL